MRGRESSPLNFKDAESYCDNLDRNGTKEWRLPTLGEWKMAEAAHFGNLYYSYYKRYPWAGIYFWTNTSDSMTGFVYVGQPHFTQFENSMESRIMKVVNPSQKLPLVCVHSNPSKFSKSALKSEWADITTVGDGFTESDCSATPTHCTKRHIATGIEFTMIMPTAGKTEYGPHNYCNKLEHNGRSDWELPYAETLRFAWEAGFSSFDPTGFENAGYLRSQGRYQTMYGGADYSVEFETGEVADAGWTESFLCVRNQPEFSRAHDSNWIDVTTQGDGSTLSTCKDSPAHCSFRTEGWGVEFSAAAPSEMNWKDAKDYCEGLSYNGKSDWQLPSLGVWVWLDRIRMTTEAWKLIGKKPQYWSSSRHIGKEPYVGKVVWSGGKAETKDRREKLPVICVR